MAAWARRLSSSASREIRWACAAPRSSARIMSTRFVGRHLAEVAYCDGAVRRSTRRLPVGGPEDLAVGAGRFDGDGVEFSCAGFGRRPSCRARRSSRPRRASRRDVDNARDRLHRCEPVASRSPGGERQPRPQHRPLGRRDLRRRVAGRRRRRRPVRRGLRGRDLEQAETRVPDADGAEPLRRADPGQPRRLRPRVVRPRLLDSEGLARAGPRATIRVFRDRACGDDRAGRASAFAADLAERRAAVADSGVTSSGLGRRGDTRARGRRVVVVAVVVRVRA